MQITMTSRHTHVTEALKNYTQEKLQHLADYYQKIDTIQVIFDIEHKIQKVMVTLHLAKGPTLHAESESSDMYSSIDLLVDKVKRQLTKRKEKQTRHRKIAK